MNFTQQPLFAGELHALKFAFKHHNGQKRKYTNQPYIIHCIEVADIVKSVQCTDAMVCAAYLHDIIEDTNVTFEDLVSEFNHCIASLVYQVSDISKPEDGNRATRKAIDLNHLAQASPSAQTIKLADIINNTKNIIQHDKKFAKVYLLEMEKALQVLHIGNVDLYRQAAEIIAKGQEEILNRLSF